jgi:hypothetical protein
MAATVGRAEVGHHLGLVLVDADDPVPRRRQAGRAGRADPRGGPGDGDESLKQLGVP